MFCALPVAASSRDHLLEQLLIWGWGWERPQLLTFRVQCSPLLEPEEGQIRFTGELHGLGRTGWAGGPESTPRGPAAR